MHRRRAMLSLFSLAIGGAASCRVVSGQVSYTDPNCDQHSGQRTDLTRSDREYVGACLRLADELQQHLSEPGRKVVPGRPAEFSSGNSGSRSRSLMSHLQMAECLDEVSLLCRCVLSAELPLTTASPALWQACADSCRRCGAIVPTAVRKVFEDSADACLRVGFPQATAD